MGTKAKSRATLTMISVKFQARTEIHESLLAPAMRADCQAALLILKYKMIRPDFMALLTAKLSAYDHYSPLTMQVLNFCSSCVSGKYDWRKPRISCFCSRAMKLDLDESSVHTYHIGSIWLRSGCCSAWWLVLLALSTSDYGLPSGEMLLEVLTEK